MERAAYVVVLGLFGLAFGSFANVVIWRFPRGESLSSPASHCPACNHPIRWYDNVPVFSWLVLRGRCRDCGTRIAVRYPLVEALTAAGFVLAGVRWGASLSAGFALAFLYLLIILSFIDLDTMRLPNPLVAILAVIGLVGAILSFVLSTRICPLTAPEDVSASSYLSAGLLGCVLGGGVSLLIAGVYSAVRKVQGFGMGDVKLLAAMGLFLGPYVLLAFFLGSLIGSVTQIVTSKRAGRDMKSKFAFGPYLALGGALTALIGNRLVEWYLSVLGIT